MPQKEPWHGPLPARERSAIDSSVGWASTPVVLSKIWAMADCGNISHSHRIRSSGSRLACQCRGAELGSLQLQVVSSGNATSAVRQG